MLKNSKCAVNINVVMHSDVCTSTTYTPVLNGTFQSSHRFYSKFCAARKARAGSRNDGFFVYCRKTQGFFLGGTGGPPQLAKILSIPPIQHLSPFLDQGLSPPQARFVPENLKNLNTFLCQIWLLLSSKVP